jgi:hypothetical protein
MDYHALTSSRGELYGIKQRAMVDRPEQSHGAEPKSIFDRARTTPMIRAFATLI